MHLTRYRPEIFQPAIAAWIGLAEGVCDSMDEAAKAIGRRRTPDDSISNFRIIVTWEEL